MPEIEMHVVSYRLDGDWVTLKTWNPKQLLKAFEACGIAAAPF